MISDNDDTRGTTLQIRFAYKNQVLDNFTVGVNSICDADVDLRDEIDKAYVRELELALSDMLDKLSDGLHEQGTKVLRPGVRIGTYVTCEHCVHLTTDGPWMRCRLGHFGPTGINYRWLSSFFCKGGEPREERNDTGEM